MGINIHKCVKLEWSVYKYNFNQICSDLIGKSYSISLVSKSTVGVLLGDILPPKPCTLL
jgi:hypothetical protein